MPGEDEGYAPSQLAGAAEFVARLGQLKERSGLTFRQLEERAADHGDPLPRSTIADVLRRPTLPRAELVAAFVRACGGTPTDIAAWLTERERLASTGRSGEETDVDGVRRATDPAGRWVRPSRLVAVATATVVVVAAGIWMLVRAEDPATTPPPSPEASSRAGVAPAGPVRIRPASAPDLCVTEGVDRSGRYAGGAVAAQRRCASAEPPITVIEPVRDALFFIKWDHPQMGVGCLTALVSGPGEGLLEPRDDCQAGRAQMFHIERAAADRYRIRSAQDGLCIGVRDGERGDGAAIVREACTGGLEQDYLIEPRPAQPPAG